jgi:hypothetical protein
MELGNRTQDLMRFYEPCNENKSVSRILFSDSIGVAIIPLAQPLPIGSSDLPEGFERAARRKSQI